MKSGLNGTAWLCGGVMAGAPHPKGRGSSREGRGPRMPPRPIPWLALAAALAACSGDHSGPAGGGANVTLDNQAAVHDSVTVAGRVLTATSHGVTYTLTIPAGAVSVPTTITLTPVLGIESLHVTQLLGAVDLQPQGLVLGKAATLRIAVLHSAPAGTALVGFGYEGDGDSLALRLPADSGSAILLPIQHFSGGGAAFATFSQIQTMAPRHALNNRNQGYVDSLALLALHDPREFLAEYDLMRAWFSGVVLPAIQNAGTDIQLLFALSEYEFWNSVGTPANIRPNDPLLQAQRDSFASAALPKLQQAVSANNAECSAGHDPGFANNVLYWQTVASDLGLATAPNGLDRASVLAGLCIQVAFLSVAYPDPAVVGQPHSLDLEAELRFPSDGSLLIQPFSFEVTLSGAQQAGPITGLSDPLGNFTAVVTPDQAVLTIAARACLFSALVPYDDICATTNLIRGATDLSGLWTGGYDWVRNGTSILVPIEFQVTQVQNAVHGNYSVPIPNGPFGTFSATLSNDTLFNFALDQASPCIAEYTAPFARVIQGEIRVPHMTGSGCSPGQSSGILLTRAEPAPVQGLYVGTMHEADPQTVVGATLVIQFGDTLVMVDPSAFVASAQAVISGYAAVLSGGTLGQGDQVRADCVRPSGAFTRNPCGAQALSGVTITGTIAGTHFQPIYNVDGVPEATEFFDLTRQ
jgi:hypothetical protein